VIVSAHLGHWYFQLAFATPSLVIIYVMARDTRRRRRRARGEATEQDRAQRG
jgi:hypothetical protein